MNYPWIITLALSTLRRNVEKIEGQENLPQDINYILALNHQSYLDPVFLWVGMVPLIKRKIYSLSKQELKWKFGRLGPKYFGMIYIDTKDKAKCLDIAYDYLKRGELICVFPEARRNYDPENLLKGKTGAARLALRAKVPVLPIGITSPEGRGVFQAIKNSLFPKKKAKIKIGKPLYFDQYYHQETTKELLENITRQIMQEVGKLCGKKYPY